MTSKIKCDTINMVVWRYDNSCMLRFGGNPVVFLSCGNKNRLAPKIMVGFGSLNDLNKYMKLPFNIGR